MTTNIQSKWDPLSRILTTSLQGNVDVTDIKCWQIGLLDTLSYIEPKTTFKLISSMIGYQPTSLQVHKRMREVIPLTQADYGFRTRFFDIFETEDIPIRMLRGIRLTATAHIHHDVYKMTTYQKQLGTATEGWFTDAHIAWNWLQTRP